MTEPNWTNVSRYISECDSYTKTRMEDAEDIPGIDEAITEGLAGLRNIYGLDLDDPLQAYALIVGFCIAYRHGQVVAQQEGLDNPVVMEFLRRHSKVSGNIGLVVRQIITNLNVPITVFPDEG